MSVNMTAAHIAGVSCHSEEQSDVRISRKGIRVISQGVRSRRLPRYARNDRVLRTEKKKFCLLAKNGVIDLRFLFYPVQRALFVVAFVAKYERYIVAYNAKEFQKTFRLGHGKVARQYRRNGQGKICEFNDVEPQKFHKAVYAG